MNDLVRQDVDGFSAVLAEYLTRLDRGEVVCREAFIREHPQHATALNEYFNDVELVERLHPILGRGVDSLPEQQLGDFGDYELLQMIGRGGMGIVYRARERATGRIVALKMLLHGLLLSANDVQRFRNEIATVTTLDHPRIVPIVAIGEFQGQLFFTMPLLEGGNLARTVAAAPTPPLAAAEMLLSIAEAVDFAHRRGVIHRDLKPANVLLDEHGWPHIADFGLARQLAAAPTDLTCTGDVLGTPNYMAPEQVSGDRRLVGPAVDIYALGAILYAMLVGQAPFHSESAPETLRKINTVDAVPPRKFNPTIPAALETICLKCLEKSPAKRYHSAADLVVDLRHFLAGEQLIARSISSLERGERWVARNPVIATLTAGICCALVGGVAFSLHYARDALEREQIAETTLYAADMNLAQQHLRSGAAASALELLERHQPALDPNTPPPWEWRYLWQQCHGELRRFEGPKDAVYSAAFSPDGRLVAAAGDDRNVWLWDTATGSLKLKLTGHTATIRGMAFSPNGENLVTVADDGGAYVWQIAAGMQIASLVATTSSASRGAPPPAQAVLAKVSIASIEAPFTTVAYSPDGHFIVAAGEKTPSIQIWDADTFALYQTLGLGPAESIVFSPNGDQLAIAGSNGRFRVYAWNASGAGKEKVAVQAHDDTVRKITWSRDGTLLASASSDCTVKTWDTTSWTKLGEFNCRDAIHCLVFSPDGKQIATAARNEPIKIWDLVHHRLVAELAGHSALVTVVAYCQQGWRLLSASEDGTVRLWDANQSSDHDRLEGSASRVRAVAFSPDGRTLATGSTDDSAIILYDMQSLLPSHLLHAPSPSNSDVEFSSNGERLASVGGNRLRVWKTATQQLAFDVELPGESLAGLAWMPNSERIAVQDNSGAITIIDATSGIKLAAWQAADRPHGGLAFSPDGSMLATTSVNHVVRVWDVDRKLVRFELSGHSGPVVCVAYNRQGTLIASSAIDDTIRLWDARTGRHLHTMIGHSGTALGLAFSADSTRLVSSSTDRLLKIWDVASGLEVQSLAGHTDWALDVAFSPDGERLASGGGDGTVRVWHAPSPSPQTSAAREAAAATRHFVRMAVTQTDGGQSGDGSAALDKVREQLVADRTISDVVRADAIVKADGYLLYWPPMCDGIHAAQQRNWQQASIAFERAASLAPDNPMMWTYLAWVSAAAGRSDVYEHACRELLDRFAHEANSHESAQIAVTSLLMPWRSHELARVKPLIADYAEHSESGRAYAALYGVRSGDKIKQVPLVEPQDVQKLAQTPEPYFVMALVWADAGDKRRATACYEAGLQLARRVTPSKWTVMAICDALQREAAVLCKTDSVPP